MKNLISCLIVCLLLTNIYAQVWEGDYELLSQEEVDAFPIECNCTEITGNLYIGENINIFPVATNISDLSPLSNLNTVGGLYIHNNDELINLDDLSNLTTIVGDIKLWLNDGLENLDGLSNITSIEGELFMSLNYGFKNTNGLNNLESIGSLYYNANYGIDSLCSFSSLHTITNTLNIQFLHASYNGLNNLTHIGGDILIYQNNADSFSAFESLESLDVNITMESNEGVVYDVFKNLTHINGDIELRANIIEQAFSFESLESISGRLNILFQCNFAPFNNLDSVTNIGISNCYNSDVSFLDNVSHVDSLSISYSGISAINSFENVTSLNRLSLYNNDNLIDLSSFSNLDTIGYLKIDGNDGLSNISGFSSLTTLESGLYIYGNDNLKNVDGLWQLTSAGGNIVIAFNTELIHLNGLGALTEIDGSLQIIENSDLININSLINLQSVEEAEIVDNVNLSDCCIVKCWIENEVVDLSLTVDNNASGCDNVSEIEDNCSSDVCVQLDCEGIDGGDSIIGSPCDDGDESTGNDVYQSDCSCVGELIDCAGIAGGDSLEGSPCDDGDDNTINDIYLEDCSCEGEIITSIEELLNSSQLIGIYDIYGRERLEDKLETGIYILLYTNGRSHLKSRKVIINR